MPGVGDKVPPYFRISDKSFGSQRQGILVLGPIFLAIPDGHNALSLPRFHDLKKILLIC